MEKQIDLGYRPRPWQSVCHLEKARFRVNAMHRRSGKTTFAIMELVDKSLKFEQDLGFYVYCAPFLRQAKAIAWNILKKIVDPLVEDRACVINEGELTVRFLHNDAQIRLLGGDNPDAMRGVRLDGCVIDEVAQIKPEVWTDILQPALSDRKGWAIFIGTPNGVNLFSELYYKAQGLPDWAAKLYTVYETDSIDPAEIERLKRDMSDASFAREYLCDFSAAGVDQLISIQLVEESCRRIFKEGEFDYAPKIIGVDPARFGDDSSVIMRRQGLQMLEPIAYQGIDNMELAARVSHCINEWCSDHVFVDVGNGTGVIDRLRQLGHQVTEVNFGGSPIDPQYQNKRTEMWCAIGKWIKDGGGIPNHQRLKQDLAGPTFWYDSRNRKVLEPKDDLKARGLPSSDYGDSACLTFAFPVSKTPRQRGAKSGFTAIYDPLDSKYIEAN